MRSRGLVALAVILSLGLLAVSLARRRELPSLPTPVRSRPLYSPEKQPSPGSPGDRSAALAVAESVARWAPAEGPVRKNDSWTWNGPTYVSGYAPGEFVFAARVASPDPDQPYVRYALERVTVGDVPIAVGGPVLPEARSTEIVYPRGRVEEVYRPGRDAVEQLFVVRDLGGGRGDLVVEGRLRSNLEIPRGKGPSIGLRRAGEETLRVSEAVAVDARGRRRTLDLEVDGDRLLLRVPASWTADAALPIVVDPLYGSLLTVSRNATNSAPRAVDVAYGAGSDRYLVVWNDQFAATLSDWDIWGQWIDGSSGRPVGVPFAIDASGHTSTEAAVAYAPSSDRFAVVYRNDPSPDDNSTADNDILAVILGGGGTFVTPAPVNVDPRAGSDERPDLAFSGSSFWLVRQNALDPADRNILGALFDADGVLVATADPATGPEDDLAPANAWLADGLCVWTQRVGAGVPQVVGRSMTSVPAFGAVQTYSSGSDGKLNPDVAPNATAAQFLVVWEADPGGADHDLFAQRVDAAGLAAGGTIAIETDAVLQRVPRVAGSPENNEWIVAWEDAATGTRDIYGQRVTAGGSLAGPQLLIGYGVEDQREPALAYKPSPPQALAAWRTMTGIVEAQRITLDARAPTALSPIGALCTTSPTLGWSASSYSAPTYEWQVGSDAGFVSIVASGSTASTSVTPASLPRATLFWRVRAVSATLEVSGWSGVLQFSIDSSTPSAPALLSPTDGSTTSDTTPTFDWTNVSDPCVVTYRIQVDDSGPGFSSPEIDVAGLATSAYTPPLALGEGTYWWRVRASDGSQLDSPWSAVWTVTVNAPPGAPALQSPANGACIVSTPSFDWSDVSDPSGVSYQLQADNSAGFTSPEIDVSGLLASDYSPGIVLGAGGYTWRVRAVDGLGLVGAWSAIRSFTIDVSAPPAPVLLSPPDASMTGDLTPTFDWNDVVDACVVTYELQADNSGDTFPSPEMSASGIGPSTYTPSVPLAEGTYWWRVRATDAAGNVGPWSASWTVVLNLAPAAPTLLSPANAACMAAAPSFDWSDVADANGVTYAIQVDDSGATFPSPEIGVAGLAASDHTTGVVLAPATYSWRVRAVDGLGMAGPWSAVRTFIVDATAPPAPALTFPADGGCSNDTTPAFNWNNVADPCGGITYRIQVDDDSTFSTPVVDVSNLSASNHTSAPLAEGTYWWRVQATDGAGNLGPWSAVWTVTIDTTPPPAPLLAAPGDAATTTDTTPDFDWTDVTDPCGVTYQIQADNSGAAFPSPELAASNLAPSAFTPAAPLATGTYSWRVRAIDGAGNPGPWSAVWTISIDGPPPAPTLLSPADLACTSTTPTLDWSDVTDPTGVTYEIQLDDTSSLFPSPEVNVTGLAPSTYTTPALAGGTYYWRVRAVDGTSDAGPWSAVWRIVVDLTAPGVSTLQVPANGSFTSDSTPFFNWTNAADSCAVSYRIQVDNDPAFLSAEIDVTSVGSSNHTAVSPLSPGTYYWRVMATDAQLNDGPWSAVFTFVLDTTPPAAPTLLSPADLACTNDTTPTLDWLDVSDPSGVTYDLQVDNSGAGFPSPEVNLTSLVPSIRTTSALSPGTCSWRVRAVDGAGNAGPWSAVWTFDLDTTAPVAPALLAPANGSITTSTPTFDWTDVSDPCGVTYHLQVDNTSSLFPSPEINDPSLVTSTYTVGAPLASGTYFWRVRAFDGAGNIGPWSAIWTFTYDNTPPADPASLQQYRSDGTTPIPWGGATDETKMAVAALVVDPESTVRLHVEVADSAGAYTGTPTASSALAPSGTTVQLSVDNLAAGTWKWRAWCENRSGALSGYVEYSGASGVDVHVVPNQPPADPSFPLQYALGGRATILAGGSTRETGLLLRATVTDPDGNVVRAQFELKPTGAPYDASGWVMGTWTAAGGVSEAVVPLAPGTWRWRVRAEDRQGLTSAWLSFGGNAEPGGVDVERLLATGNAPPGVPTILGQAQPGGAITVITGGVAFEGILFRSVVSDPDGDAGAIEVEAKPVADPFDGTDLRLGSFVASGSTSTLLVRLPPGPYHWRARIVDARGEASPWTSYDTNADFPPPAATDFNLQSSANATPTLSSIQQYELDGATALPAGSSTPEGGFTARAFVSDPNYGGVSLEVEVKPVGERFTDVPSVSGPVLAEGTVTAQVRGLAPGSYHWQVRVVDWLGSTSPWQAYGGNLDLPAPAEVDVVVTAGISPGAGGSGQFRANGSTAIAAGGSTPEQTVVFRATATDPDSSQARLEVELVPNGSIFSGAPNVVGDFGPPGPLRATVGGLAVGSAYKWRLRVTDVSGNSSPWADFGAADPDFTVAVNNPPGLPASLGQRKKNGTTAIPLGGSTGQTGFQIRGTLSDPDAADQVRLQVEVKPASQPFDGTGLLGGPLLSSGAVAVVETPLPVPGFYHWRARVVDSGDLTSSWVEFDAIDPNHVERIPGSPPVAAFANQFKMDGTTVIPLGEQASLLSILRATGTDPDEENVVLEFELRTAGTGFSDAATHSTALLASGSTGSVTLLIISGTGYHWQYRAVDESGMASPWLFFGANLEPSGVDFYAPGTGPPAGAGAGGGGGGCGLTGAEGLLAIALLRLLRGRRKLPAVPLR